MGCFLAHYFLSTKFTRQGESPPASALHTVPRRYERAPANRPQKLHTQIYRQQNQEHHNRKPDEITGIAHPVREPDQRTALRRPVQEHIVTVEPLVKPHNRRNNHAQKQHRIPDMTDGNCGSPVFSMHDILSRVNDRKQKQHRVPPVTVDAENTPEHIRMIPVRKKERRNCPRRNQHTGNFPEKPLHPRPL